MDLMLEGLLDHLWDRLLESLLLLVLSNTHMDIPRIILLLIDSPLLTPTLDNPN